MTKNCDKTNLHIFLKVHTQNAVRALIAVCQSGSGKPGLAKATNEELEIIFTALKNEAECVRDAALRGLDSLEDAVPNDPSEELYTIMVISRKKISFLKYSCNFTDFFHY